MLGVGASQGTRERRSLRLTAPRSNRRSTSTESQHGGPIAPPRRRRNIPNARRRCLARHARTSIALLSSTHAHHTIDQDTRQACRYAVGTCHDGPVGHPRMPPNHPHGHRSTQPVRHARRGRRTLPRHCHDGSVGAIADGRRVILMAGRASFCGRGASVSGPLMWRTVKTLPGSGPLLSASGVASDLKIAKARGAVASGSSKNRDGIRRVGLMVWMVRDRWQAADAGIVRGASIDRPRVTGLRRSGSIAADSEAVMRPRRPAAQRIPPSAT